MQPRNNYSQQIIKNSKGVTHKFGGTFTQANEAAAIAAQKAAYVPPTPKGPSLASSIGKALLAAPTRVAKAPIEAIYRPKILANEQKVIDNNDEILRTYAKAYKEGKITKERYQKITQKISERTGNQAASISAQSEQLQEDVNPRKNAAALLEVGLTPFALSTKGLVKGAQVVNAATKLKTTGSAAEGTMLAKKLASIGVVPSKMITQPNLAKTVGQQAVLGGASGAASSGQKDEFTAAGLTKDVAIGAGLSAGIVGGGALAAKGIDKGVKASASAVKSGLMKTETGKKIANILTEGNSKIMNDLAYVKKELGDLMDGDMKVYDRFEYLVGNAKRSNAAAEYAISKNAEFQKVNAALKGMKQSAAKEIYKQVNDYQTAVDVAKVNGKEIPANTLTGKAREVYEGLNKSTKKEVQALYDVGSIDKKTYEKWMADDSYIRVQRDVEDHLLKNGFGSSSNANVGKSVTDQKLKGSTKEALDPVASYVDWTRKVYHEVEANKAAKYLTDQLEKAGKATKAVDSTKVLQRREAYQFLKDTKPGKQLANRMVRKNARLVRIIQKEIDKLNKRGLESYLKRGDKADTPTSFRYENAEEIRGAKRVKDLKDPQKSITAPSEITGTLKTSLKITGEADPKKTIQSLFELEPAEMRAISKKLAKRDPKLKAAMAELEKSANELEAFNNVRAAAWKMAKENADMSTVGKTTLSRRVDGIKEVFEVDPKVAEVIKGMDPITLGPIAQWLVLPARVLRTGATAANVAFTLPNYIADQIGSAVISKNALYTHGPKAMWYGIKENMKYTINDVFGTKLKLDDVTEEFYRLERYTSSPNLYRNIGRASEEAARLAGLKPTAWQRAKQFGRKFEDVVSSTEYATRLQNFKGQYEKALNNNMTHEQAFEAARIAARTNSVDFIQRGELSRMFAIANPYLNASIQGVRTTGKAFAARPTATTAKIAALVVAPTVASTYHNLSDPERAIVYANLSEYTRNNNFVWVVKGGDEPIVFTFKLPPGLKSFAKPFRNMTEAQYLDNRQSFLEDAKNILVDPFSPIGTNKWEVLGNITPQPIKPAIESATNRSFFSGEEIVSDYQKELPTDEQVNKTTGTTYRDIGKFLNVSPKIVNNFVRSTGGGVGEQLFNTIDRIQRGVGRDNVVVDNRGAFDQTVGRFTSGNEKNVQSQFYETYNIAKSINKSGGKKVTEAVKAGDYEKAKKIADDTNALVQATMDSFDKGYGKFSTSEERDKFAKLVKEALISTEYKNLKKRAK